MSSVYPLPGGDSPAVEKNQQLKSSFTIYGIE